MPSADRLPPTDNPKFDRVAFVVQRADDEDAFRREAAEFGRFSADQIERAETLRVWSPLHSSKEAFIYTHYELFDADATLVAEKVDVEDTGSEPD